MDDKVPNKPLDETSVPRVSQFCKVAWHQSRRSEVGQYSHRTHRDLQFKGAKTESSNQSQPITTNHNQSQPITTNRQSSSNQPSATSTHPCAGHPCVLRVPLRLLQMFTSDWLAPNLRLGATPSIWLPPETAPIWRWSFHGVKGPQPRGPRGDHWITAMPLWVEI